MQLLLPNGQRVREKGRGRTDRRVAPECGEARARAAGEGDLVIARAAVSEVLTKGGKDISMPWENPNTGARGTITPLATDYDQDGRTCRDFLASYVKNGSESWLQGEACRASRGKWEVRNLRPWKSHVAADYTLTDVMMPFGNISSGLACRWAMPCSWV